MRDNIIKEIHNSGLEGHFGKDKMLSLIKDKLLAKDEKGYNQVCGAMYNLSNG